MDEFKLAMHRFTLEINALNERSEESYLTGGIVDVWNYVDSVL